MAQGRRPTGRVKKVGTSGGENANRRGSGLGTGRVGGYSRPTSGTSGPTGSSRPVSGGGFAGGNPVNNGGNRGTSGSGLLGAGLAFLLGTQVGGSGNRAGGNRGGCLKRILILILIIFAISYFSRNCGINMSELAAPSGSGSVLSTITEDTSGYSGNAGFLG